MGGDGYDPNAGLVGGSDGVFYGTTSAGGAENALGTVFKLNPDGSGYSVLHSFISRAAVEGTFPGGRLMEGGEGSLYGTTASGGSYNQGTVFKLNKDGSLYGILHSFTTDGIDGYNPRGGVVEGSDGVLYGATGQGGSNNLGTVFKLNKDGSHYNALHSFEAGGVDGRNPSAELA